MRREVIFIMCETPDRKPDRISLSGSKYWDVPEGLIRQSDHWGLLRSDYYCLERIAMEYEEDFPKKGKAYTGLCPTVSCLSCRCLTDLVSNCDCCGARVF